MASAVDDWFRGLSSRLARMDTSSASRPPSLLLFRIQRPAVPPCDDLVYAIDGRTPRANVHVGLLEPQLRARIEADNRSEPNGFQVCTLSYADEQIFLGLVNSTRSMQYALLSGDVKISGDKSVLKALGQFLRVAKTDAPSDVVSDDETVVGSSSSFQVSFLPATEIVVSSGDAVRYAMRCTLDSHTWTVYKRFTEFTTLDRDVRAERGGVTKPSFPRLPPRGGFFEDQRSPAFIVRRQGELEKYLSDLLASIADDDEANLEAARMGNHCNALKASAVTREFFEVASHVVTSAVEAPATSTSATTVGEEPAGPPSQLNKRLEAIEARQRHALLSRVRRLEHAGSWAVWGGLCAATGYVGSILSSCIFRQCWTHLQRTPVGPAKVLPPLSHSAGILLGFVRGNKTLFGSALLLSLGWAALWRFNAADTGSSGVKRKISILYSTTVVLAYYKYYRWYTRVHGLDEEERALYLSDVNDVASIFVFRCIDRWGGFWTKAGQYMSARADVTPAAYVRELSSLQDGTKSAAFEEVRVTVERSLRSIYPDKKGIAIEDVFSRFDPEAIASASIAQVHRAVLKEDGRDVVVKVQHAGIGRIMRLDMAALLQICRLIAWSEPEFDFQPMMTEWTKAAIRELDFRHESTSLMEVAKGLSEDGDHAPPAHLQELVVVPKCIEPFTTEDMLVLEFSPGVSVGSPEIMESLDLDKRTKLLQLITEATAHTIFHLGVFNGDPHPGNILVELEDRETKESKPVLLDFGLSKRLDDPLRLAFCRMITSASSLNLSSLIESFEDMGWVFDESNDSSETMDVMRFFFRDTAPSDEARKELLAFNKEMARKGKARREEKLNKPVKAFPGDILFFVRALELLRGLCSKLRVRQSPMKIMSDSAMQALRHAVAKHDNRHCQQHAVPWKKEWPMLHVNIALQDELKSLVNELRAEGLVSAIQICVVHNDAIVVNIAEGPTNGLAHIESGADANSNDVRCDSIFNCFSCTKALVATSLHLLVSEGKADYDDPVSKHWPEFGGGGKSHITIAEMMSHRAGLHASLPSELSFHMLCDWQRMCAFFETAKPSEGYDDGLARYHALTFGWICGRLVEILSGISFSEFVRTRIAEPLGLQHELVVGVPPEWTRPTWDDRHTEETRYHANRLVVLDGNGGGGADVSKDEIQNMIQRIRERTRKTKQKRKKKGAAPATAVGTTAIDEAKKDKMEEMMSEMLETFKGKEWMLDNRMWNSRRVRAATIPAANGHFSARALAIFYSSLLSDGKVLSAETVQRATQLCVKEYFSDGEFGLGFKRHKYRDSAGQEQIGFGHAGAGGSVGLAIPHAKVSFAMTVSLPVQNAAPRKRIFKRVCERLNIGVPLQDMSGMN